MKICAACHKHQPKESYSKKQWKLDECHRRCKVCITNNREIQSQPPSQKNNDKSTKAIIESLELMCLEKEISDEELFKPPPPKEDCPICFLQLPTLDSGWRYQSCCGKVICSGCIYAPVYDNQGNEVDKKCPFCRIQYPITDEEAVERAKKRIHLSDPMAICNIGCDYSQGDFGFPQDYTKALELWHRAGELGHAKAYNNIGSAYLNGEGVEADLKKAKYYYEQAAIRGDSKARCNLGCIEAKAGCMERALKHFMIAIQGGGTPSLKPIQLLYSNGHATKEAYTKALQLYQAYLGEIKSPQRDKAAAFSDEYRYY